MASRRQPEKEQTLREIAADRGETTYDTGKPCKRGHRALHYVSNGGCVLCIREKGREFRANFKERMDKARAKNGKR